MQQAIGKYRWTICALLFFATTVNYLDRQVLSLLQPHLEKIYNWTSSDYANITAMFQFTYAIFMLFAGRIIDKLGTKKGYAWAIVIWSLGAIIHAEADAIGKSIAGILGLVGVTALSVSVVGFMFPVPSWPWVKPVTFLLPSKPPPNTFRRKNVHWLPVSLTPALT